MTIQQTCLSFDFCLDRNVPPVDDVTSLTAIGGNAYQGAAFTTRRWSVVLAAQGPSPAAEEALEKLCRTCWRPIYGFVTRQGVGPDEAKDLTQGFLLCCSNAAIWMRFAARRGGCVLICSRHSNISWPTSAIVQWQSNEVQVSG